MPSLWDLVDKKEEPQKEVVPEEVTEVPVAKEETPKTTKAAKTTAKKETKKEEKEEVFEYPFSFYTEGHIVDISNYGFEDNKKYTSKEITNIMLQHRHYEFAGDMTYNLIKEDNTLVATAKQFKKG